MCDHFTDKKPNAGFQQRGCGMSWQEYVKAEGCLRWTLMGLCEAPWLKLSS